MFKEEESNKILKIFGEINNIEEYQKIYNHARRKHKPRIQTNKIDEIRNYLIEEINQNELMRKKHKKVYRVLNYIDHLLVGTSTVTRCVFISVFASLVGIAIGIASSAIRLKPCVITAGIKKYKSIIKEKQEKHDKIVLLAKSEWNSIKVLISKDLINSNISHGEFVLVNDVLKEIYDMNEEIKSSNYK